MLNRWETFFLIFMTVPIMGHVVILPLIYDVAGRDSWLSAILSFPFGVLFIIVIYQLRRQYEGLDFSQMAHHIAGNLMGKIIVSVCVVFFLFLSAFSAATIADITHIAFLPQTPVWALVIFFFLFCLYAATKGTKAIAMTAILVGLAALLTGHSISFIDLAEKDVGHLFPLLEFGFTPVFWGTIVLASVWIELLFLFFLKLKNMQQERYLRFWIAGGVGILFTMVSTMTGTIMIFGMGQADNFNYPALETVRILTLGFIDRFDIYGMILMSFGCYIRSALFFQLSYEQIVTNRIHSPWGRRGIFWGLGILCTVLAIYIAQDFVRIEHFTMFYTNALLLAVIPFLLYILSLFKGRTTTSESG